MLLDMEDERYEAFQNITCITVVDKKTYELAYILNNHRMSTASYKILDNPYDGPEIVELINFINDMYANYIIYADTVVNGNMYQMKFIAGSAGQICLASTYLIH